MGYNLKKARDGNSISKIPKLLSLGPWDLNFRKIKRICMENVVGEQGPTLLGLALQQIFLFFNKFRLS